MVHQNWLCLLFWRKNMPWLSDWSFFKNEGYINFKTPNAKKNFFQNYADHLNYLIEVQLLDKLNKINEAQNFTQMLAVFNDEELMKHISIFDKLRDGYDYMDEVGGVFVAPVIATAASLAALGLAIYEGFYALAIRCNLLEDDGEAHGQWAGKYLFCSVTCFALSMANALKSAISLVTRPLVTLFSAQASKQDEYRFRDENRPKYEVARLNHHLN